MSQVLQVNGDYLVKVSDGGTITLDTGLDGNVIVTGNLVVDNNLIVKGNLTLGDEGSDNVLVLGEISSSLIPRIGNIYDLGGPTKQWRDLYVGRVNNPFGNLIVTDLVEPVNPQDAATKNYVDSALGSVDNVLYVAKSGNDQNDGRTLTKAKLTIKSAVEAARDDITKGYDVTIFVKSGDYIEDNPIRLPAKLSIYGDGLRATTVRPLNKTQDLFWVTNGNYIANITMKDHEAPSAAVAFPPPTDEFPAVAIFQSPYVQNCTSITTTGCGMRVDGSYMKGLKSMVLDAYTQYNQGGLGIHMLNRGNTQLVSAFTINCDIAFLCTTGGFCSLTNSNSSFGNFGLVSDGVSEPLYNGILTGSKLGIVGDDIVLNNLVQRPNIGDAVSFDNSTNYYTVTTATELSAGDVTLAQPIYINQPSDLRTARQIIRVGKDKIATDTIDFVNDTFRGLDYNQFKCTRDTNLIVDAAVDDMALGTNYKSIQAGLAYSRLSAAVVREEQLLESLDALLFTKNETLKLISVDSTVQEPAYVKTENNFNIIYNLFAQASAVNPPTPPAYQFNSPVGVTSGRESARDIILANREFLIREGIAYIEANLTFNYNRETCQRDIGLIIDAISYDLMFGSNFRSITAGRSYYRAQASTVIGVQKTATIDAFTFLKQTLLHFLTDNAAAYESVESNMNLIIDILDQGLSAIPPSYTIPEPTTYDVGFEDARNLIEANRNFVKAEVTTYIENTYPSFEYEEELCRRDIDLILDAVYYDMTYRGNLETLIAGNAYYSFGTSLIPGEETQTAAAYEFMKNLISDVAQKIDVTELQSVVPQVTTGTAGSVEAATFAESLITDIIDIVKEEPKPEIRYPSLSWVDPEFVTIHELFQDEKDDTQRLVTNYIDSRYFLLDYDRGTCQRDIGLIIDAIAYDLMFGSNFRTITAGRAYARGTANVVSTVQKTATIDAFNKLKSLLVPIVAEEGDTSASDTVADLMDLILTILAEGINSIPEYVIPEPTAYNLQLKLARNLIESNREFIKAEVIAFVEINYSFLDYNQNSFENDIGLIIDSVGYDMMFGSNFRSIVVGKLYLQRTIPAPVDPQKQAILDAFAYLKGLLLTQVTGDVTATSSVSSNMDLIINIIDNGVDVIPGSYTIPSPTGYDSGYENARNLIDANRAFIEAEVIEFIRVNYVVPNGYTYNQTEFETDIRNILDAVYYDMTYRGNIESLTIASSYYINDVLQIAPDEVTETLAAYNFIKSLIANVAQNIDVTELQTVVPQVTGTGGSSAAGGFASDLIEDIRIVISGTIPPIDLPSTAWVASSLVTRFDTLQLNRADTQTEVTDYINANFALDYDPADCARDVDYILDAVYYDMTYGGNLETLIAGRAYYSFNQTVIPGEEIPTLAAYDYMKDIIELVAQDIEVTALQTVVDQIEGTGSNLTAAQTAGQLIEDIRTIIATPANEPTTVEPSLSWVEPVLAAKGTALIASKDTVKDQVTDYIDSRYNTNIVPFTYDREKCLRDVGLIVDALAWDAIFGSNFRTITAARAYSRANASLVTDRQKQATIEAYEILRDYVADLVSASAAAVESVTDNMDMLIDIFDQGLTAVPDYNIPTPIVINEGTRRARDLIEANRDFIIEEVVTYINETIEDYDPFVYDRKVCQRDVGLILDAIGYDIMFGSNFRSITAARSYYREGAGVVTSTQKAATLDAFAYLKDLILNTVSSNSTAVSRATVGMDIIISVLDQGLTVLPLRVLPEPTSYDVNYANARNLIDANRQFIEAEVIKYIEINYPSVYASFDQTACERDISYILDAVFYDMTYGGNMETIIAGNAYYSNSVLQLGAGEQTATLAAYNYMKSIIINIAQNIDISELQTSIPQIFDTAGSLAAANAAGQLIENIRTIISTPLTPPATVNAATTWVAPTLVTQYNNLQTNKSLIQGQVTHYIDVEYVDPDYNEDKCRRDIDFILDAVYYDMTYGGNMETAIAANSYFVGAVTQIPGEVEATLDAYRFMKTLIIDVAQNISVTPVQSEVTQVTGIAGSLAAANIAGNLIQNIVDVIDSGVLISAPTLANTSWVSAELLAQYQLLTQEVENVKLAVADYIESKFFLLTYNREKCKRDIGYIIDALGYDVMFNSNFRSIVAARSYYRANSTVVLASQKSATIGALRRLKEILIVAGGGDSQVTQRITNRVELIVSILNLGPTAEPAYQIPNPIGYLSGFSNARALISANRAFIRAEVIKFVEINYPSTYASMDADTCRRDIDYILDAVFYDITYSTNAESLVAGRSYYAGTNLQLGSGELVATLAAYSYMKTLVEGIAINTDIAQLQNDVLQVFGAPGSALASTELGKLIQTVINSINDPINPDTLVEPNTSWVDSKFVTANLAFQSAKETIKTQIQQFIDTKYSYSQATCARDIGYILDAMVYDQLYGGNSQTMAAAETYYSAGTFQIGARERIMTANTFKYLKSIAGSCLLNIPVTRLQTSVSQDLSEDPATANEVIKSNQLFMIVSEVVENGFTSVVTLNENIPDFDPQFPGAFVTFHQYSLITASGQTFEWVGAGINVNTSLPYLGGAPLAANKAIETNGGKVYWTGTDQFGDFNIGGELVIRRDSGTIEGRTFTKSLFAVLTPYILAVGD